MLSHLGMQPEYLIRRNIYLKIAIPIAGCAHQPGICRFGTNPKTSVLDTNCKPHELDNLYVVETSFFVSIGAVNPSLIAIANSAWAITYCRVGTSDPGSSRFPVSAV